MSRAQRLGSIALAAGVMVAAFVLARPDGEESAPTTAAQGTQGTQGAPAAPGTAREPAAGPIATTESRPEERIELRAHEPAGGVRRIEASKGAFVRLVVPSDSPDEIHLHGYEITREVRPPEPARLSFRAQLEGVFELESHAAEDQGRDPVIARLVVR